MHKHRLSLDDGSTLGMIRDVLPTDVEFARGLVHASHSDAEILALLASRGVHTADAARLVEDLRHGRTPSVKVPFAREGGVPPAIRRGPAAAAVAAPPPVTARPRPVRKSHRRRAGAWWFLLLLFIFAWALGYAFMHLGADASQEVLQKDRHTIPPAPNKAP